MQITIGVDGSPVIERKEPKEMLSLRKNGSTLEVRINSSSLSLMQACWRKTYYSLVKGYRSNLEGAATIFGTAIHKAMEIFYTGKREDRKLTVKCTEVMELLSHGGQTEEHSDCLLCNAVRGFCGSMEPLSSLEPGNMRSRQSGVYLLENYFQTYINDPFIAMSDSEGPIIERRIEYPIFEEGNLKIIYHGTVDCILKNEETGSIVVCDHKTSSRVGQEFYNRLKPNHQYTGYFFGAEKVLGIKADGFLVNCLGVKAKPKTNRGGPPQFPRQVTQRSEEDFEEFRDTVVFNVMTFLHKLEGDQSYWNLGDTNSCAAWGGCQYLDVCSAPKSIRQNILNQRYQQTLGEIKWTEFRDLINFSSSGI